MRVETWNKIAKCTQQLYKRRWLILILAALAVAAFGIVKLYRYYSDMAASRRTDEEIRQIYYAEAADTETPVPTTEAPVTAVPDPTEGVDYSETSAPAETPMVTEEPTATPMLTPEPVARLPVTGYPGNPDLQISNRFKHLRKESKYIVGWLTIDRLIDEAVVQRDNVYYLNHDIYGKENVNGALFMDIAVNLNKQPFAYLVYGHNMKTGEKFGSLRNYENISFYHSNPYISFETMYESGKYVIFSVGNVSTVNTDSNYLDFYALVSAEIPAREKAIEALKQASVYTCNIEVKPEDQILLLITCVERDEERRIVAARRVQGTDSEQDLLRQIMLSKKK